MKLIDKIRLTKRVTTAMDKVQVHQEIMDAPEIELPVEELIPDGPSMKRHFSVVVHSEEERHEQEQKLVKEGYAPAGWSMYIERYTKGDSETVICMVY